MKTATELPVLYQDPALLVVDKPSGVLSLPDGWDSTKPHLRSLLEPAFGRLWVVHRLDRETSGLMVLARDAEAHRHLNTQFQDRRVDKGYHALVVGDPAWQERTVRLPLRPDGDRRHRTVVDHRRGKRAETHLRALRRFGEYSLLAVQPTTGRTHQVRAHLRAIGHPLLGDQLYGDRKHPAHRRMPRAALHACTLALEHPTTSTRVHFEAPYPPDFGACL
jgi:RluA family pseudouridine synthase